MSKRLPTSLPGGFATLGLASALAACPQGSYLPVTDTLTDTTGSGPSTSSEPTATSDPTTGSEPPPCNMNGACDQGESVMLCPDECKACGNGEIDGGEACDDGVANSKDNAYHEGTPDTAPCNSSCTKRVDFCGDGICQMYDEDSISCAQDGCTPVCGNGVMEVGEDCDDGNLENSDACLNNCKPASCGDGFIAASVEECDDTNLSDNDACTSACKMATCGDGFTWAGNEDCDDANDDDADTCDTACKTVVHRKVFVSSAQYSGSLGGLVGADAKCQTLAKTAKLSGTFKAWLSDATMGPAARFDTTFVGIYELVDGTIVAHGWTDLADGMLVNSIGLDELNNAMAEGAVWSNSSASGETLKGSACVGWTSAKVSDEGKLGLTGAKDSTWTDSASTALCSIYANIYCFEDL